MVDYDLLETSLKDQMSLFPSEKKTPSFGDPWQSQPELFAIAGKIVDRFNLMLFPLIYHHILTVLCSLFFYYSPRGILVTNNLWIHEAAFIILYSKLQYIHVHHKIKRILNIRGVFFQRLTTWQS